MRATLVRPAAIGALFLGLACAHAPDRLTPSEPGFRAIVEPDSAKFFFPFANQPVWEWDCASTPDNTLEYMWAVEVQNGDRAFQFGYMHYKGPGFSAKRGTFDALLLLGQRSVFEHTSSGYLRIPGAVVSVSYVRDALVVSIDDPDTLHLLFSEHPSQARFQTVVRGERHTIEGVRVKYGLQRPAAQRSV